MFETQVLNHTEYTGSITPPGSNPLLLSNEQLQTRDGFDRPRLQTRVTTDLKFHDRCSRLRFEFFSERVLYQRKVLHSLSR